MTGQHAVGAATYRKKPIVVEAIHYDGSNRDAIAEFMGGARTATVTKQKLPGPGRGMTDGIAIHTLEGLMLAPVDYWIIKGVAGEFYPCRPDVFEATYEKVTGDVDQVGR